MSARYDLTPWTDLELTRLGKLCEAKVSGPQAAKMLNDEFHGGQSVRTDKAIFGQRTYQGWKLGQPCPVRKRPKSSLLSAAEGESVQQTVEVQDSGDQLTVRTFGSEVTTIDELVARAKIDLTKYEVDRPETSMHETTVRDLEGKIRKVQNFRIVARFRLKQGPNTREQVEMMLAEFRKDYRTLRYPKHKGNADILQAIAIFDPHIGKLAWPAETGDKAWDTPISLETLQEGALHLMAEGDRHGVGERAFCIGGDFFQHDGKGMTTKGTVIDYDSRFPKMYRGGVRLLIDLIATSAETMPTRVYVIPGNHDNVLSFAMQEALAIKFENDKRVTIDQRWTSTKFFEWGRCLIGLDHGDKGKQRLPSAMASLCEEEWGKAIVREILTGHFHSKAAIQTFGNVVVRTMDALCPPDKYHADEKFVGSPRTIEAFRYHRGGMVAGTDSWSPDLNRAPRRGT